MSNTFAIAAHHLRRVARKPGLILLLMAVPITLAVIEYGAFGPTVARGKLPPVKVLLIDEDGTLASRALPQFFAGGPLKDTFSMTSVADRETARRAFQRNEASALITVPKGFQAALLEGRKVEVRFAPNPVQTFSPGIVEGVLEVVVLMVNSLHQQAMEPIRQINELIASGREATSEEFAAISRGFYQAGRRMGRLSALEQATVKVSREGAARPAQQIGTTPGEFFAMVFPGLAIFALYFISQVLGVRLLRDRDAGLQRRIAVTPTSRAVVLWGGVLYLVVGLLALLVVLGLVGALIFRLPLRNPGGLILVGAGFAVFAAALQLLVMSLASNERTVSFIGTVVVMLLSLAGGTFVPAEQYPEALQAVARVVPNGAAQQAFIDLLVHGRTLPQVAPGIGLTWLWAALALGVALVVESRRLRT